MNKKEFFKKHHLHFDDVMEEIIFVTALDKLYLEFTHDQIISIVEDFMANADNIYNDTEDEIREELSHILEESGIFNKDKKRQA